MDGRVGMFLYLALLLAVVAPHVAAQDASFQASVDRNPVGAGEQFTLSLTLSNAGMGGGSNLTLPDLGKFHMMSGPNQSTSMQFINGAVSSSVTYSYILQPKEPGTFTIGSVSIEAGGKKYTTQPLTLQVVKGSGRPRQQAGQPDDVSGQIGDNLFLRATVDRTRAVVGEQINLTYKLYTRVSVANYSIDKNPSLTGFWSEDIEIPKNISLTNEVINGKQYRVGTIRRMALFPTQAGTLEISPMEVQTTVQVQSRSVDPFDAFFRDPFGRSVNYRVKCDPVRIKVDPLPPGPPSEFKGAVGRFTMNTSVDRKSTKANEPVTLTISISGSGNIKLLESPDVEFPPDFEQYAPKISENTNRQQERISGTKTIEYLFIPRYPGEKIIKPIAFAYFDLGKREYVTLRSPSIELTVTPGAASTTPFAASGSREDVRLLSQDIRFIKVVNTSLNKRGDYVHKSGIFVVMLAAPLLALAGAFVVARQRRSVLADEAGYRNKRAVKIARKGLREAENLLKEKSGGSDGLQFYTEVARAMWKYLGDKLNIPQSELSIDTALAELARRSVNGELSTSLKSLLETCEMARFAPASLKRPAMEQTYNDARRIIIELEKILRAK